MDTIDKLVFQLKFFLNEYGWDVVRISQDRLAEHRTIAADVDEHFRRACEADARRNCSEPNGYVYFIQAGDGPIKIGWAKNPNQRIVELQIGSAEPLRLLHSLPGKRVDETAFHRKFARYSCPAFHKSSRKTRREWFEAPPVLNYLAELGVL